MIILTQYDVTNIFLQGLGLLNQHLDLASIISFKGSGFCKQHPVNQQRVQAPRLTCMRDLRPTYTRP